MAFGGVAASWANIDQAWSNGNYDPSKVGSYNWTDHGKQTGITHEHTLSASGGSDKFQGYASFGYLNQKGTQPGQAYERYTLKVSFDANPVEFFKMGASVGKKTLLVSIYEIFYFALKFIWSSLYPDLNLKNISKK